MTSASSSPRMYLAIWFWLAALMLVSVLLSEWPLVRLPLASLTVVVMALSTVKALLVALYYMHLKGDRRLLAGVAVFPLVVIACAVLLVLSSHLVRL